MFGFGQTVHAAISKLHESFPASIPTIKEAQNIAENMFHLKHIPPSGDPVNNPGGYEAAKKASIKIAGEYIESYSSDFNQCRQVEVRFEIPASQTVISGAIDLLLKEDNSGKIIDASVIDFKSMDGGTDPASNPKLDWTELSLQVQLYAKASKDVLGEDAKTGSVHLLKNQMRQDVPISEKAQESAIANIEWAIKNILRADFPKRPHSKKCSECDFELLCPKNKEEFANNDIPPPIHTPIGEELARAFSLIEE